MIILRNFTNALMDNFSQFEKCFLKVNNYFMFTKIR